MRKQSSKRRGARSRAKSPASALPQQSLAALVQELDAIVWQADLAGDSNGEVRFDFTFVSHRAEELIGAPSTEWVTGEGFWGRYIHPDDQIATIDAYAAAVAGGADQRIEYRVVTTTGRIIWLRDRIRVVRNANGKPIQAFGVMVDTTDRKRAETDLRDHARHQVAVAGLGQLALEGVPLSDLMNEACRIASVTLDAEYSSIFEVLPEGEALLLRAGTGWKGTNSSTSVLSARSDSEVGFTLRENSPVLVADFETEQRFRPTTLFHEHRIASSVTVLIQGHDAPFGVLGAHSRTPGRFGETDVHFLRSIANVLATAIGRKRSEETTAALLDVSRAITGTFDVDQLLDRVQRRAADVLPCDAVFTLYWNAAKTSLFAASQYIPGAKPADRPRFQFDSSTPFLERLRRGATVVFNDLAGEDAETAAIFQAVAIGPIVAVPLSVRRHDLGAFIAARSPNSRPFDHAQVSLLEGIARQLALAIEGTELYRAQEEEAEVSFALARVGREMMSSLNTPDLLDRLCQLTTQALDCDFSHTWLLQPDEDVFVPVAGWGDRPEHWESMKVLRVPRAIIERLLARLDSDEIVQISMLDEQDLIPAALPQQYGISRAMYVALRRGGQLLGLLTSGYFSRTAPFSPKQERMARGVSQLTAIALANARLFEELERANDLKSDFVATMSHELRTPLNVILGYIELLHDGLFGALNIEQEDTTRRIERNARELLELINATLDLSRLESGRVIVDIDSVDIGQLLREVAHDTQDLRRKPDFEMLWELEERLPSLASDPLKLKVILKNLVNNAIKFTAKGRVTIRARRHNDGVEIAVTDTGIGIAPEGQAAIFEPFRQADRSIIGRFGGIGLGLYIVRRLLGLLGGTITLESEVGRGSTFRVWVPEDARTVNPLVRSTRPTGTPSVA